jgi:hypothetical protein
MSGAGFVATVALLPALWVCFARYLVKLHYATYPESYPWRKFCPAVLQNL